MEVKGLEMQGGEQHPTRKQQKRIAVVVSHTHWDREWYLPFETFRARLVKVIDYLIELLEQDHNFKSFVLDGQTVVLEDYFDIRPEQRPRIARLVKAGRLLVGPWYVLCDEFLVSSEAIIRSLLFGHEIAEELGGVMKVGYVPDPFGHVSQLPQILRGFDIDSMIFCRGLGTEGEELGTDFIWIAPDVTSSVQAVHQLNTYHNASALGYPRDFGPMLEDEFSIDLALEQVRNEFQYMQPYNSSRYHLFNNGTDHLEAQSTIPEVIESLNELGGDEFELRHGTFSDYLAAVREEIEEFPVFQGEMHSGRFVPHLPGVASSRLYLKQANEATQTALEKYTEPLTVFAWLHGAEYPKAFLRRAWKLLLRNHPHDDICGCSVDEVHRAMMCRFAQSRQIADFQSFLALRHFAENVIRTKSEDPEAVPLVVYNPLGWQRTSAVQTFIYLPEDKAKGKLWTVVCSKDLTYPVTVKRLDECYQAPLLVEEKPEPGTVPVAVEFMAYDLPPLGCRTYYLTQREAPAPHCPLEIIPDGMENEYFRITIHSNGSLTLLDKYTGIHLEGLHVFEDAEDCGDEYDYSALEAPHGETLTTREEKASWKVVEQNACRVTYEISVRFKLPKSLTRDRKRRARKKAHLDIVTDVTLYRGIRRLDFVTRLNNTVKDHRLRVLFGTGIETDCSHAESKFDVVTRRLDLPSHASWRQRAYPFHPQDNFVDINDEVRGVTLINKGLPEFEAVRTRKGIVLALTLLRCVGWLSRADAPFRPYHVGPHLPTPDAQCQGNHEFRYSIVPHEDTWEKACSFRDAYEHNVPVMVRATTAHDGTLPPEVSFVTLEPRNVLLSAVKKCENRDSLIIRLHNITGRRVHARLRFHRPIKEARQVNLNEEPIGPVKEINGDHLGLPVNKKQIVTVEVRLK